MNNSIECMQKLTEDKYFFFLKAPSKITSVPKDLQWAFAIYSTGYI